MCGPNKYALDHLHADGIALHTNYHGQYLGDPAFEPVMADLDQRHAVAVLHPTSPACWEAISFGRPRPLLEFPIDTTRAVFNLVLTGTLDRYPNIRFVIPHTGAALPVLADRVLLSTAVSLQDLAGSPSTCSLHCADSTMIWLAVLCRVPCQHC